MNGLHLPKDGTRFRAKVVFPLLHTMRETDACHYRFLLFCLTFFTGFSSVYGGCTAFCSVRGVFSAAAVVSFYPSISVSEHTQMMQEEELKRGEVRNDDDELLGEGEEEKPLLTGEEDAMMEDCAGRENIPSQEERNLVPCVGMEFDSEEAAKIFYDAYAGDVGFSIRASVSYRCRRNGKITSRKFVCSREGFHIRKDFPSSGKIKRPRASVREGCKAFMWVKRQASGKWAIVKNFKDHNHELVATQRKVQADCLQSYRHVPHFTKRITDVFQGKEVPSSLIMPQVGEESHGTSDGSVTNLDSENVVITGTQDALGKDVQDILDCFKHMQAENPAFFYAIQVGEDQRVRNCFWTDSRSRMACKCFGDVLSFDMKYKINQHQTSVATFTGVNHYLQPVLFGCALLSDESESTLVWLFNAWLAAMSGHRPTAITTKHDMSIQAAVAQVFPGTRHRFCKGHILTAVPRKLPRVCHTHQNFEEEICNCINLTETIDEFELGWESLLRIYNLRENEWIRSLYDIRRQWVPVYLRDAFFAEISVSQQSESSKSIFDGYINAQMTLQEFVGQYREAVNSQYEREAEADFEAIHTKPLLKTTSPMEKQAAYLYTRKIFTKFQEELFETLAYTADKFDGDTAISKYRVVKFGENQKAFTVTFNASELRANCSCQMFESSGIVCKHVLTVFKVANVLSLPAHYILRRWTQNAKSGTSLDEHALQLLSKGGESLTSRFNNLCQLAIKCAEKGSSTDNVYDVAVHSLREALEKIVAASSNIAMAAQQSPLVCEDFQQNNTSERIQAVTSHDPQLLKTKESPNTGLKYVREKSVRRIRRCKTCNQPNHDIRTCPTMKAVQSSTIHNRQMSDRAIIFVGGQSCTKNFRVA